MVTKTTRITTATTTLVVTGPCNLVGLLFGKRVASGIVTIYDDITATGTPIFVITEGVAILTDCPLLAPINRHMEKGLTIVTSQAEEILVKWNPNFTQ
jgi:hypothetical protein